MTTINGEGFYCCICFTPLTHLTCSVVNGQKVDSCIECENYDRRNCRIVIYQLRNEIHELKLKLCELEKNENNKSL